EGLGGRPPRDEEEAGEARPEGGDPEDDLVWLPGPVAGRSSPRPRRHAPVARVSGYIDPHRHEDPPADALTRSPAQAPSQQGPISRTSTVASRRPGACRRFATFKSLRTGASSLLASASPPALRHPDPATDDRFRGTHDERGPQPRRRFPHYRRDLHALRWPARRGGNTSTATKCAA